MSLPNTEPPAPGSSHWALHAQRWRFIGGPLRPCAADLEQVQRSLARHGLAALPVRRALLLGVTPELANLPLPADIELLGVDQSPAMIAAVWPGDNERRRARVGDWFELDLADGALGVALGDGCFSTLDYPRGYRRLASSLGRVLTRGGLFSIRAFCRPATRETVEQVFEHLLAAKIETFHAFKWRLAMALQADAILSGVSLDLIWRTFHERVASTRELATHLGWAEPELLTIDNYRGSQARYTYSTTDELVAELAPEFRLLETWHGSYELAERCPTLLFRRR